MNNIKVTATYETPNTEKFDALMKEYLAAKSAADEAESYYEPLSNAAGAEKLAKIYEQLQTIVSYLKQLSEIRGGETVSTSARWNNAYGIHMHSVDVSYCGIDNTYLIYLDGRLRDSADRWFRLDGIVTNWNEYGLYRALEKDCLRQLQQEIDKKNARTEEVTQRYKNMTNN